MKRHYDARGHEVHDWMTLKQEIRHPASNSLLSRNLLCKLVIIPAVEIRISKTDVDQIVVVKYGTGVQRSFTTAISEKTLKGLRKCWAKSPENGWNKREEKGYFVLWRDARVTLDSTRRYS